MKRLLLLVLMLASLSAIAQPTYILQAGYRDFFNKIKVDSLCISCASGDWTDYIFQINSPTIALAFEEDNDMLWNGLFYKPPVSYSGTSNLYMKLNPVTSQMTWGKIKKVDLDDLEPYQIVFGNVLDNGQAEQNEGAIIIPSTHTLNLGFTSGIYEVPDTWIYRTSTATEQGTFQPTSITLANPSYVSTLGVDYLSLYDAGNDAEFKLTVEDEAEWTWNFPEVKGTVGQVPYVASVAGIQDNIDFINPSGLDLDVDAFEVSFGNISGSGNLQTDDSLRFNPTTGFLEVSRVKFMAASGIGAIYYGPERFLFAQNHNSALGGSSGNFTWSGDYNTVNGYESGNAITTASYNSYFGALAGKFHTEGANNTFIGAKAGSNNITGTNNIFLGYSAGENETGSNLLYIHNNNSSTPLIKGDFSNLIMQVNGKIRSTDIGTTDDWWIMSDDQGSNVISQVENNGFENAFILKESVSEYIFGDYNGVTVNKSTGIIAIGDVVNDLAVEIDPVTASITSYSGNDNPTLGDVMVGNGTHIQMGQILGTGGITVDVSVAGQITLDGSTATGTYTDENARDAVGDMFYNVAFDYDDALDFISLADRDFGDITTSLFGATWTIDNAAVSNAKLANSTISGISLGSNLADLTATNTTLTFSGTYNGGTARTIGLNLGNANTWTQDQSVPDEAYGSAWNGSVEVPTKNAVYDKINAMPVDFGTVTNVSHTGNTSETKSYSISLPANTLRTGDIIEVVWRYRKTGTAGTLTPRIRFGTTDDLAGTVMSTSSINASALYGEFSRWFIVKSSTSIEAFNSTQTNVDDVVQSTSAVTNITVDLTVQNYMVFSLQLGNSGDTGIFSFASAEVKRY